MLFGFRANVLMYYRDYDEVVFLDCDHSLSDKGTDSPAAARHPIIPLAPLKRGRGGIPAVLFGAYWRDWVVLCTKTTRALVRE